MARDHDEAAEGAMWREFGLRRALDNMPPHSPGRGVIEALLARGKLTPEEARHFKIRGLQTALANMPEDSPGRAAVESLLASERNRGPVPREEAQQGNAAPTDARSGTLDLASQLERLAQLHELGRLTDAEFESAKRLLLG